jgi:hypothetical protein
MVDYKFGMADVTIVGDDAQEIDAGGKCASGDWRVGS